MIFKIKAMDAAFYKSVNIHVDLLSVIYVTVSEEPEFYSITIGLESNRELSFTLGNDDLAKQAIQNLLKHWETVSLSSDID